MDPSAALAAMKVAGVLPRLLFLGRRIDRDAARAGEMSDQLISVISHDALILQFFSAEIAARCDGRAR